MLETKVCYTMDMANYTDKITTGTTTYPIVDIGQYQWSSGAQDTLSIYAQIQRMEKDIQHMLKEISERLDKLECAIMARNEAERTE